MCVCTVFIWMFKNTFNLNLKYTFKSHISEKDMTPYYTSMKLIVVVFFFSFLSLARTFILWNQTSSPTNSTGQFTPRVFTIYERKQKHCVTVSGRDCDIPKKNIYCRLWACEITSDAAINLAMISCTIGILFLIINNK